MENNTDSIIFSLDGRKDLKEKIISEINRLNIGESIIDGVVDIKIFSDGEISVSYKDSVRGRIVYLLTSPRNSDDIMKLNFGINAAKLNGASQIIIVMPYMAYSRQDKVDTLRSSIGAKVISEMIENRGATSVILFDLHAEQIQSFFTIPVIHISGKDVFGEYIHSISDYNTILCSADVGGTKRVKKIRDFINNKYDANLNFVIMDKTRKEANKVESMVIIGDVKGKNVIIIDDMIDTGNSVCKACSELINNGALSVKVICTHGILSGKAFEIIGESVMTELVISDSLNLSDGVFNDISLKGSNKIKIISAAKQIALAISAINKNISYELIKNIK